MASSAASSPYVSGHEDPTSRDYWDADASMDEEEEEVMLQDALESMAAEAQEEDRRGAVANADDDLYLSVEDDDDDADYDPFEEESGYDQGDIMFTFGDEEDEGIDIRDLLRAYLADSLNADDGNGASNTTRALNSLGLAGLQRLLAADTHRSQARNDDDDDYDERDWYGMSQNQQMSEFWDPIKEPIRSGQELLYGGEFGSVPKRPLGAPPSAFRESKNLADLVMKRKYAQRRIPKAELSSFIPNTNGTVVAKYPARVYCGQYSQDSSFFYTCTQDFKVHVYDTTVSGSKSVKQHEDGPIRSRMSRYFNSFGTTSYTSLKMIKSIQGRQGNWTITDANLSPDNQWMIYSSITPFVHLVPTRQHFEGEGRHSDDQVMLDFSNSGDDDVSVRWRSAIWSIRFSGDSREIVAGAHFGDIYVYDIEARRRVLRVAGHTDDVNGVAFADSASSNVLISGSDDSYVKIWDRRSLSGGKPAGVFCGHTEGITFIAPKGDGRYCISNGKDQSLKLWDLRKMHSSSAFESFPKRDYGLRDWDYRNMYYRQPRHQAHPQDCSVATFRGHAVLKTLIRCHFSPLEMTGGKYVYSASADGKIHIWNLEGEVVQVLDRALVKPLCGPDGSANDPSEACEEEQVHQGRRYCTVRDVSWHSSEPSLMSTAWDGQDGDSGSIAKHELATFNKRNMSLEDAVEAQRLESFG